MLAFVKDYNNGLVETMIIKGLKCENRMIKDNSELLVKYTQFKNNKEKRCYINVLLEMGFKVS